MKNLNPKIKLLVAGAVALLAFFILISTVLIISIHKKNKQLNDLNKKLDELVDQIAGSKPPNVNSLSWQTDNLVVEFKL